MSVQIMSEIWDLEIPDSRRKLILICLADNANTETRECWPSVSYIAKRCGCTRQTVHRHLSKLESDGLISRKQRFTTGGRKRSNRYFIAHMGKNDTYPMSNGRDKVCNTDDTGVCNTGVTKNRNIEPPIEPNPLNPPKTNGAQAKIDLPDFIDKAIWDDYVKHRKEIRKKMTPTASNRLLIKLNTWHNQGVDVNECIEESIANGWQGIHQTNRRSQNGNGQRETAIQRSERITDECRADIIARSQPPVAGDDDLVAAHAGDIR